MTDLSKVILGTGNYKEVLSGNTVSVTGDGGNHWNYFGPSYKKLAPKLVTYIPYAEQYEVLKELAKDPSRAAEYLAFRKQIEDKYIRSYYDIRLKGLNAEELLLTLRARFGDNIILLCHESVEEFCHRRLIADFIELETGIYIPEITVDEQGNIDKKNPIRYKKRLRKSMNK